MSDAPVDVNGRYAARDAYERAQVDLTCPDPWTEAIRAYLAATRMRIARAPCGCDRGRTLAGPTGALYSTTCTRCDGSGYVQRLVGPYEPAPSALMR